ncbi:MAG: hypothetical protein EBS53_15250 [Bacteroidetes bacterium]|nr:hypothetical protein [Bacteroidota bacterium]
MVLGARAVAQAVDMALAAPAVLVAKQALALPLGPLVELPVLVAGAWARAILAEVDMELLGLFGRDALGLSHQLMLECHRQNK